MSKKSQNNGREIFRLKLPVAIAAILGMAGGTANADDFIVYSPHVTKGQNELELRGFAFRDGSPDLNGTGGYELSVSRGVTDWWKPELYLGRFERNPGEPTRFVGYELENTFQLTDNGKYWADLGFLFSYEYNKDRGATDAVEFGPLLEKRIGRINQRLNLIWEKAVGAGADRKYEFRSAYSVSYRFSRAFAPGLEAYYRPGDHASHIGPVIGGEWLLAPGRELEYSAGVLFGVNRGAPDRTFVARVEYDFF